MSRTFNCRDVGIDCSWSITADTNEEILKQVAKHAKEHEIEQMTSEIVQKVINAIKEQ